MRDLRRVRTHVEILKHSHPELVVELAPEPPVQPAEISGTADQPVLKWNGKTMHSVKSPEGEAQQVADRMSPEPARAYVAFGLGLGHLAEAARKRLPERSALIVIEPDLRILRETLTCIDLRPLLFDNRIRWVSGKNWPEYFRRALRQADESGCRPVTAILNLPAYGIYFGPALTETRGILAQFINERDIDTGTRKELWHLWNANLANNLPALLSSAPVRNFVAAFDQIPVVLVGAGPSLDACLPEMRRLRERALIVAVDTALAPLLDADCNPDLVLAMDAQEENARDFLNLPNHSARLLFDAFCYPSIPCLYPAAARIASQTGHVLSDIRGETVVRNGFLPALEYLLDFEFGFLQNGGSVITAGYDLARIAGCAAVGLVGVDLSFPGYRMYSRGTNRSRYHMSIVNRHETCESKFFDELSEKAKLRVEGIGGKPVWSDRVLILYKHWMEDAAAKTRLPSCIVGPAHGLALKGYAQVSVDEFLGRFSSSRDQIETRLNRATAARPEFNQPAARARLAELRRDLSGLETNPAIDKIGPFDLVRWVDMASYEVGERLRTVCSVEPESEHLKRRQQASRACLQWARLFLDGLESALDQV